MDTIPGFHEILELTGNPGAHMKSLRSQENLNAGPLVSQSPKFRAVSRKSGQLKALLWLTTLSLTNHDSRFHVNLDNCLLKMKIDTFRHYDTYDFHVMRITLIWAKYSPKPSGFHKTKIISHLTRFQHFFTNKNVFI